MARPIRRVVTGTLPDGRSTAILDGVAPNVMVRRAAGWTSTVLWHTDAMPARYAGDDRSLGTFPVAPPPAGTIFRVVEFPPEAEKRAEGDNAAVLAELGLDSHAGGGVAAAHRTLHKTDTVDYVIILSGEIDMLLDDGEVHLAAGDVLVQQGTLHGFVNRGREPCVVAAILVDARGA
ncbi:MAG: cupin domain-containing protein [Alphaproteobacteria bacterium]